MSKFRTAIPVDVAAVKALLPPDSTIERVTYDPAISCVVLDWEHGRLETMLKFNVDFPQELLRAKQVPQGVTVSPKAIVEEPAVVDNSASESASSQPIAEVGESPVAAVSPVAKRKRA